MAPKQFLLLSLLCFSLRITAAADPPFGRQTEREPNLTEQQCRKRDSAQEEFAGIFHCCTASLYINKSEKVRLWYRDCCNNCKPPYAACKILAEQKKKTFAECVKKALDCSDTCMRIAMDKDFDVIINGGKGRAN